tara:strand:- start:3636 stop:4556 length:921 start_codon:yes stop_codon:yes gene_type:complete
MKTREILQLVGLTALIIYLIHHFRKPQLEGLPEDGQGEGDDSNPPPQLICPDTGEPIPEGQCDCYGNVLDACNVCGGTALDESECGDDVGLVIDDNGDATGESSSYTIGGRTYQTRTYPTGENGAYQEWFIENFAYVGGFLNNGIVVYGNNESQLTDIQAQENLEEYGALYSHDWLFGTVHPVLAQLGYDGWRIPTTNEYGNLLINHPMETLRSVSGWSAGYEGSNDAFFNLKGGGFSPDGVNFSELGNFGTLVARFGGITSEDVYTNLHTGLAPLSGGETPTAQNSFVQSAPFFYSSVRFIRDIQ